jgi:tRNA threonylcarbamoyladenosine biosynthesis protein TsaB
MATILLLETATRTCSVALSRDGHVVACKEVTDEKYSHAEQLSGFIKEVLEQSSLAFHDLNAVAVSAGPGSYTGLRIGTSTAKGLCFALDIPLIAISTLDAMADYVASAHQADFVARWVR